MSDARKLTPGEYEAAVIALMKHLGVAARWTDLAAALRAEGLEQLTRMNYERLRSKAFGTPRPARRRIGSLWASSGPTWTGWYMPSGGTWQRVLEAPTERDAWDRLHAQAPVTPRRRLAVLPTKDGPPVPGRSAA